jgi:alpha-L-fucosidase
MSGCRPAPSGPQAGFEQRTSQSIPSYLKGYESLYAADPRSAALEWFKDSRFGLFMHYGLYSILGRHEWVMYRENIPLGEYEKLKDKFTKAEMKYVNITARHHDSFCLFDSKVSDYNSMRSPARRDIVSELAEQCQKKGLGLFLYYSYALDWRHPYFYPRSIYSIARPKYEPPEPRYLWRRDEDSQHYIDFVHAQITELLTNYGPLAGIWLDPIMGYYARPDLFPIEQTYELIRKIQPQTLISFKQGANGEEDFAAPERGGHSLAENVRKRVGPQQALIAQRAWRKNKDKHNELCNTLQPRGWGYMKADDGKHRGPEQVIKMLADARAQKCNLLLNTGPLPDGAIHTEDVNTLLEVGRRIRRNGWPGPEA